MLTKNDLINNFIKAGLKPTDTVFSHTSYKAIAGKEGIEGGPQTILDAYIEYFGKEGLVVFPTMSWKMGYLINKDGATRNPALGDAEGFFLYGNDFDVRTTTCDYLGILPELFRQREGVVRSLCPTSSVAAYGKDAKEFCAGHEKAETPMNWNSPWGKLYERKAKILFAGTGVACNTFMHVIEEHAEVPNILAPYIWRFTVTDYDGNKTNVEFKRHEPGHNHYYDKMEKEFLDLGIMRKVKIGNADTHLADAVAETDYMVKKLKAEPWLFTHEFNKK
ncbi:MAG: AAC(3) family N-acetyltransferase [Ruminococcaceae bacterium]|nr:AAC(3) family N-acetyltransferase [Oscillospiraceae bacterium]